MIPLSTPILTDFYRWAAGNTYTKDPVFRLRVRWLSDNQQIGSGSIRDSILRLF